MSPSDPSDFSRFDNFDTFRTTYKTVIDHDISAHILIPKHISSEINKKERYPVLIRIHGGGFITASSLFPPWFAPWTLDLANRHSAIIVSPDYRLIPESTMDDVLEDIEHLWGWVQDALPTFVLEKTKGAVHVDTSRIITAGDSAGGYLSLQLGLSHPDEIRAVIATYPVVDTKSSDFTELRQNPTLDVPSVPAIVFEEHCDQIRKRKVPSVISADETLQRGPLMFSAIQNGKFSEFFPPQKRHLHILDKLDDGARFPRGGVLVLHGKDDSMVPVEGSVALLNKVRDIDPSLNFHLETQPGDHGFDGDASLDDEWLYKGLKGLVTAWLGQ